MYSMICHPQNIVKRRNNKANTSQTNIHWERTVVVGVDPETTELTRRGRSTLAVQVTVLANTLFCSIIGL